MKTRNILIVEDEPALLQQFAEIIRPHCAGVITSNSLAEIPGDGKPGVVVLDLNLPNGRGLNTISYIRKKYPEAPILVITGFTDYSLEQIMGAGADDLLYKAGMDETEIVRAIQKAIIRRRAWIMTQEEFGALDQMVCEAKSAVQQAQKVSGSDSGGFNLKRSDCSQKKPS